MNEFEAKVIEKLDRIIMLVENKNFKPASKIIDKDQVYKISDKKCKTCDGLISWDGWTQGKFPIHVDSKGKIINNGKCLEFEPNYKED